MGKNGQDEISRNALEKSN